MDLIETLLQKKIVYQGKYLRAEERIVRLPDGKEAMREVVIPPDAVGVLAVDDRETIYFVRQYRTAIGKVTLEIPAGIIDPGEKPLETAGRECEEEIGLRPKKLDFLFGYYHSVGFSTGKIEVFLGRGLVASPTGHADAGEFLEVVTVPFEEAYRKALTGEIVDSKTLLAILWYQQRCRGIQ